ncbi:hypothetical protein [Williamsia deligens]|uniref:Uncharacterized protein n=1 Tax=Williamsia deligens TaxID=321325 RepID=A0ABW3G2V4_9NOCA|nr:hypothetical protein [Williamsia deligens]MCP2194445.1 hypothetical protein [Williamsia deligens]
MTRRAAALGVVVLAVVLMAVTVWLGVTAVHTATYPPLELGGRTVAGPYTLTEYRGDRIGAATVCAIAAVVAAAWALPSLRAASRP